MATSGVHRGGTSASAESANPMGTRKTLIIMVTVVGCIAILWPKVFYPMMVGPNNGAVGGAGGQYKPNFVKDHRGSGCCDVVLDQEKFANASINASNQHDLFRKRNVGPPVEDGSIRQERPPHLRPETIHPAMRERGRAIPHVGSVHSERPQSPPRIVEGRPGPIPGMRPPMGAGSHQSTKSVNSMGFIMPLYTIGIVSFFIYTILKLLFKKNPATPYPEIKPDTTFREEVFTQDQYIKRPVESGKAKLDNKTELLAQTTATTQQSELSTTSSSSASSSSRSSTATVISALEESSGPSATQTTIIDQVPTSVSNVTNPKFLTLNLVNYSLSESSGNNSDSSASASSASKPLAAASPSAVAGTADVSAAVETAETSGQLMELDLLRRKLDETEQAMTKIIANMGCIPKGQETEESDNTEQPAEKPTEPSSAEPNGHVVKHVDDKPEPEQEPEPEPEVSQEEPQQTPEQEPQPEQEVVPKVVKKREAAGAAVSKKKRQTSSTSSSGATTASTTTTGQPEEEQRGGLSKSGSTVKVIPMEKKVAYEPGHHASISRPTSPVQSVTLDSSIVECDAAESKCVLLETKVPQSSKVLVANSDHSVEKLNTATATATSPGTEGDTPFDLNLIVVFESVSNLNQGRSLELNVLLGSEPTTSTATVVNSSASSSTSSASPATRVASPTREVVLSGKMKLSLVKLDDVEKKSTDDVVVKSKDDSKKSSRLGPNEE